MRPMVTGEQISDAGITMPVYQQTFTTFAQHAVSSQKPIDLSCHEMEVSVDHGSTSVDHQTIDDDMADSQGT